MPVARAATQVHCQSVDDRVGAVGRAFGDGSALPGVLLVLRAGAEQEDGQRQRRGRRRPCAFVGAAADPLTRPLSSITRTAKPYYSLVPQRTLGPHSSEGVTSRPPQGPPPEGPESDEPALRRAVGRRQGREVRTRWATSAAASSPYAAAKPVDEAPGGAACTPGCPPAPRRTPRARSRAGRRARARGPTGGRRGSRPGRRRRRRWARPGPPRGRRRRGRSRRPAARCGRPRRPASPPRCRRGESTSSALQPVFCVMRAASYSLENRMVGAVDEVADHLAVTEGELLARGRRGSA